MENPKSHILIGILVLMVVMGGCTIIHSESADIPQFDDGRYHAQVTQYRDVLDDMGPPTKMSQLGEGMVWFYENIDLVEHQFGFSFNTWPYSLFKLNLGSGDGRYGGQLFVFDGDGRLLSAAKVSDDMDLGSGMAFQFVFIVSSLVNLSDVRDKRMQHEWGQALLVDVPRGLNSGSDLESGANGLQLLTTPLNVGQHTLARP